MTIEACADLVRRGDPDRFLAVMAAPVTARSRLFPLYAFNLEVARAPWVSEQPLIVEMRLQWWRDVIENAKSGAARAHEVAGPLHQLIFEANLPVVILDALIAARRWDVHSDPHEGIEGLDAYLEATGAGLMWLAAQALGAPREAETAVRAFGWSAGASAYLLALRELAERGRKPLPDGLGARDLAERGLEKLRSARALRGSVPRHVIPALLSGWQTGAILRRVVAGHEPMRLSEFSRRGRLLWQSATGRW